MCSASATQISVCTMIWTVHASVPFRLDLVWHRWEVLCVGIPGKMDGGSGTGESHPAAIRAWLYGHKMPPACWQEWLPRENTFLITSLTWGRLLWRQNHTSGTIIPCLYSVLLSSGKQTCSRLRLPSTQHALLLLQFLPFLVSAHTWRGPTDALQYK